VPTSRFRCRACVNPQHGTSSRPTAGGVAEERLRLGDEARGAHASEERERALDLRATLVDASFGQQSIAASQTEICLVVHLPELRERVRGA